MLYQLAIVLVGLILAWYFAGQDMIPGVIVSYVVVLGGITLLIAETENKINKLEKLITTQKEKKS